MACPQLARADISLKMADSRYDPMRTKTGSKSRSAASP
jgi:hypothetical protein